MTKSFWESWWELVTDDDLVQGDLLQGLQVFWLPENLTKGPDVKVDVQSAVMDCIVISASCDLESGGFTQALVAQVVPATQQTLKASSEKEFKERFDVVRKGMNPSLFMLARCPSSPRPFSTEGVVIFKNQYQLPISYLRSNLAKPRPRLRHPYRELLGNWVGESFARVGPEDWTKIPPSGAKVFAAQVLRAVDS